MALFLEFVGQSLEKSRVFPVHLFLRPLDIVEHIVRDEDLASIGSVRHSRRLVDARPVVVHAARRRRPLAPRLAHLHAHVHTHSVEQGLGVLDDPSSDLLCPRLRQLRRPRLRDERLLDSQAPAERLPGRPEGHHERRAFRLDFIAPKLAQHASKDAVVEVDRVAHRRAVHVIPKVGDALHSGKNYGNCTLGGLFVERGEEVGVDFHLRASSRPLLAERVDAFDPVVHVLARVGCERVVAARVVDVESVREVGLGGDV
mmetsp:Transcript_5319/g.9765  ORF Transcript_5319/g.9765 Transcript_5319/m.9765 type:complete len:258 (+) Transcript_5319:770-1543(+)